MTKSFIDTNVFVHWIILYKMRLDRPDDKELWKEFRKIKPSFDLIEKIKNNGFENLYFCTSPLAISEIFYAVLDEYRCRRMYRDGVPLSSWQRVKERINVTDDDIRQLTNEVISFLKEFDVFEPLNKDKKINLLTEHFDYTLISRLVLENKLRTHDAVLISSAINYRCDYFITEDTPLRRKKLSDIKVISSQNFIQTVNE